MKKNLQIYENTILISKEISEIYRNNLIFRNFNDDSEFCADYSLNSEQNSEIQKHEEVSKNSAM